MRWVFIVVLLIAVSPGARSATTDSTGEIVDTEAIGDEYYLFNVSLNEISLTRDLLGYSINERLFLDFAEFLRIVEFPVNQFGIIWAGWHRNPENYFLWRMNEGSYQIGNEITPVPPGAHWFENDEGVFVSEDLIDIWFGISITSNLLDQTAALSAIEPLPVEERRRRELLRLKHRILPGRFFGLTVPDQYQWITSPLVDVRTNARIQSRDGEQTSTQSLFIDAGFDFLKHSTRLTANLNRLDSDAEAPVIRDSARLTFDRYAASADDAMFLGVDHYTFGDVFIPGTSLITRGTTGAGIVIERARNAASRDATGTDIAGEGPPGWDAELYHNNVLVEFDRVDEAGRYLFENRDLAFGENEFIVRLYGPQGQEIEAVHDFWTGGVDLEKHDYRFSINHVDPTRRFIGSSGSDESLPEFGETSEIRLSTALTDSFIAGAGYVLSDLPDPDQPDRQSQAEYPSIYGRLAAFRGVFDFEFANQADAGDASRVQYLTSIRGHTVRLLHESYDEFHRPRSLTPTQEEQTDQLLVSGPLPVGGLQNYTVRVSREIRNGSEGFRASGRLGFRWGNTFLTNELEYDSVGADDQYNGSLRIRGRFRSLSYGGEILYSDRADDFVQQVNSSVRWQISKDTFNEFLVRHRTSDNSQTFIENILSWKLGNIGLTLNLNADTDNGWGIGFGINTYFGADPVGRGIFTSDRPLSNSGRVLARLCVDDDPLDASSECKELNEGGTYSGLNTPDIVDGTFALTGVPTRSRFILDTSRIRIDDPFLVPVEEAYTIYTHPGSEMEIDVRFQPVGDIEGNIIGSQSEEGIAGVPVELLGQDGEVLFVTESEFDGYFSFTSVPIGRYVVRVLDNSGETHHEQDVELKSEDGYLILDDLVY